MIKKWVRALILLAAFFLSVIISFSMTNQVFDDRMVVLGSPTLPRISFEIAGEMVNYSFGYVEEMELTSMRGTITPLTPEGFLSLGVERNGNEITSIGYEVFSLDGTTLLRVGSAHLDGDNLVQLSLGSVFGKTAQGQLGEAALFEGMSGFEPDSFAEVEGLEANYGQGMAESEADALEESLRQLENENRREAVLRITLFTESQEVYFYTRISRGEDTHLRELFNFARNFHQNSFSSVRGEDLRRFLEWGACHLTNGLQRVTLNSDITEVQWGDLNPQIQGNVEWRIYESSPAYTSFLATYQVVSHEPGMAGTTFNVREFYRLRYDGHEIIFQLYDRTMNQVFTGLGDIVDEYGLFLGLAPRGENIGTNEEGTVVAFVQERELWVYSKERNQLALVFSFAEGQGHDRRSNLDKHEIQIINVDENGSTVFAVYGYMNRGVHEGTVGVSIYYYSKETNSVEEKAFISSNRAFGRSLNEAGNMVFFGAEQGMVYFVTAGSLYQINASTNRQTVLFSGLEPGQYTFSENGALLAWQTNGDLNTATTIRLKDLRTGREQNISAPSNTAIRPLGFINDDFIYGFLREEDFGRTIFGEEILPAYRLEIIDTERNVVKCYQGGGRFIGEIAVEGNQITLNRFTGSNGIYSPTAQDFILYNEEEIEHYIFLENVNTELITGGLRITFAEGLGEVEPSVLRPNKVLVDHPVHVALEMAPMKEEFYVYALGQLQGVYTHVMDAVKVAEPLFGVVVSASQNYIWERGNRFLEFNTQTEPFERTQWQTPRQAMEEYMALTGARRIDFSGANLIHMFYVINRGFPVIGVLDEDNGILITSYTLETVTFINPETGVNYTYSFNDVNDMMREHGNVFIGFIEDGQLAQEMGSEVLSEELPEELSEELPEE